MASFPELLDSRDPDPNIRGRQFERIVKDWLRQTQEAHISAKRISKGADKLGDQPPVEFTALLNFCIEKSTRRPADSEGLDE